MNVYILLLFVFLTANIAKANTNSTCICTTVPCPHENVNTVIMGNGYATIEYIYIICMEPMKLLYQHQVQLKKVH